MALMRYYLDYNSTHPILPEVLSELTYLINLDANPSSQHSAGKKALKAVHETDKFLLGFFGADSVYEIIYHSGATEYLNTVFSPANCDGLIYSLCDHSAVHEIAKSLTKNGVPCLELGHIPAEGMLLEKVKEFCQGKSKVWFNFQWVNNETGEVLDSEIISRLKAETNCYVHVDAVQSVGKIFDFKKLNMTADVFTYSGHKFGALKGIGFSFVKKDLNLTPFILGGGQQDGKRSGTLNIHGVLSLKAALNGHDFDGEMNEVLALKNKVTDLIAKFKKLSIVTNDSINTICVMHESMRSDAMLVHFDLQGLDVSTGSACTSGSLKPSLTLQAMGFKEGASQNIRLSFGRNLLGKEDELLKKLESVFSRL